MSYDGMYSGALAPRQPFARGLVSPISTQGEITQNVLGDTYEYRKRHRDSTIPSRVEKTYPGGTILDNVHVKALELVFGWKTSNYQTMGMRYPGEPSQKGFTSLNGLYYGEVNTTDELEERMYFIGQSKSDYNFESTDTLKHGFACMVVGSGSTYNTGFRDLYPGDKVCWKLVPFHQRNERYIKSGYDIPVHAIVGKPRNKLLPMTVPYNYRDTKYTLQRAYHSLMSSGEQSAGDVKLSALEPNRGKQNRLSPSQEHALAVKQFVLMSMLRGIEALQKRGVIKIVTPAEAEKAAIKDEIVRLVQVPGADPTTKIKELQALQSTSVTNRAKLNYQNPDVENKEFPHFANMFGVSAAARVKTKRDQAEATLFMAVKLGLVESEQAGSSGLKENKRWVNDVLRSAMFSYDHNIEVQELYAPWFENLRKPDNTFGYSNSIEVQYYQRAKDYLNMAEAGLTRAKECIDRRVLGRALNYSKPSERLDFILGHQ